MFQQMQAMAQKQVPIIPYSMYLVVVVLMCVYVYVYVIENGIRAHHSRFSPGQT